MAKGNAVRPPSGAKDPSLAVLADVTGMPIANTGSIGLLGLAAVSGAGPAAGTAALCRPPGRNRIIARTWWVITSHRVGVGCVNAWVQTSPPVTYAIDRVAELSTTPSTAPISVAGVADMPRLGSLA